MRPTKYRGKRKDNEEWVYGYYIEMPNQKLDVKDLGDGAILCEKKNDNITIPCIAYLPNFGTGLAFSKVIPETVGQFTGKRDKKRTKEFPEGQEIYGAIGEEGGDIICSDKLKLMVVWLGQEEKETPNDEYINNCWATFNPIDETYERIGIWALSKFEVIGNIHENPELLKKEVNNATG